MENADRALGALALKCMLRKIFIKDGGRAIGARRAVAILCLCFNCYNRNLIRLRMIYQTGYMLFIPISFIH